MQTVERSIDELKPADYNPRRLTEKQAADLRDSMEKYGFVEPVVVNMHKDRKNIIIGGHQRVRIAAELGMETVPCVELKLTKDKERELNIRLNKNTGEWDFDLLANYFDAGELEEWGFTDAELFFDKDLETDELPELDGEESDFTQVTITLHKDQKTVLDDAIKAAKEHDIETGLNENSNGNAVAFIAGAFLRHGDVKD